MRHFEDLDFHEISERLDRPLNTVRSLYFRARQQLRDSLITKVEEARQ